MNKNKEETVIMEVYHFFKNELVIKSNDKKLEQILKLLSEQKQKLNTIMAKQDQINASLAELNDATNAIAARIQALIDAQNAGDPVSQESLDQLQAVADQLKAMGQNPESPVNV
jgi:septal ring factor EnvC (AmiA/AmiB activator)